MPRSSTGTNDCPTQPRREIHPARHRHRRSRPLHARPLRWPTPRLHNIPRDVQIPIKRHIAGKSLRPSDRLRARQMHHRRVRRRPCYLRHRIIATRRRHRSRAAEYRRHITAPAALALGGPRLTLSYPAACQSARSPAPSDGCVRSQYRGTFQPASYWQSHSLRRRTRRNRKCRRRNQPM